MEDINGAAAPNTNPGHWDPSGTGFRLGGVREYGFRGHGERMFNEQGMPVSRDWATHQGRTQAIAEAQQGGWDPKTQTAGRMGGHNVDMDPTSFLHAHGIGAVNAQGNRCYVSPAQARGLIRAYLNAQAMCADYPGSEMSFSFTDDALHHSVATVSGRLLKGGA